jgi:hypothetical protein
MKPDKLPQVMPRNPSSLSPECSTWNTGAAPWPHTHIQLSLPSCGPLGSDVPLPRLASLTSRRSRPPGSYEVQWLRQGRGGASLGQAGVIIGILPGGRFKNLERLFLKIGVKGRPFGRPYVRPIRPLKAGGSLWMGGKGVGRQALFSINVEIVCRLNKWSLCGVRDKSSEVIP